MSSSIQLAIPVYKNSGETPLEAIERFKKHNPDYADVAIGYAGRLDPMADGVLLLLTGEENKNRKHYERLPKTYSFEMLLGVATDTFDPLGYITQTTTGTSTKTTTKLAKDDSVSTEAIKSVLESFIGAFDQPYPPYSSPRVQGKPLFWWARAGRLDEITIPSKQVEVYSVSEITKRSINKTNLQKEINERINAVKGEFRQKETLERWDKFFTETTAKEFTLASATITCSSGTYIRSLCNEAGKKLGVPALAYAIHRTAIGPYSLSDSVISTMPESRP